MRFSSGMIFQLVQSTTTNLWSFFKADSTARSRSLAPRTSTQAKSPSFSLYSRSPSALSSRCDWPRASTADIPTAFASLKAFAMSGMSVTSRTISFSGVGSAHYLHRLFDAAPLYHYPPYRPHDEGRVAVLEDVPPEGHSHRPRLHDVVGELEYLGVSLHLRPAREDHRDRALPDDLPEALHVACVDRLHD